MNREEFENFITQCYSICPDYPWISQPTYAVYRHSNNNKWFAVVMEIPKSKDNNIVYTSRNNEENKDVYMVALRDDNGTLIGYYEKHEYRNNETSEMYCLNNKE